MLSWRKAELGQAPFVAGFGPERPLTHTQAPHQAQAVSLLQPGHEQGDSLKPSLQQREPTSGSAPRCAEPSELLGKPRMHISKLCASRTVSTSCFEETLQFSALALSAKLPGTRIRWVMPHIPPGS